MEATNETAITIADTPQQIAPVRRSILTITESQVERIKLLAGMMAGSGLEYRKMKSGDIFIKMMKGLEIGLEPVASMDLIDVIQGKPTLKPQGMLALAHGSGQLSDISITDDGNTCTVKMKRGDMAVHVETFSAKDATAMGLAGKDNWKKQPATMRKWRAISAACRVVFPDIIQGMYIPEELSPDTIVDDGGEIVDAQYDDVAEQQPKQHPPDPASEYDGSMDEPPPEINGDRPEVYSCKFTHKAYEVAGKTCVKFANCDPTKNAGSEQLIIINAYGRSSTFKGWLGTDVYDELGLAQYDGAKKTTPFTKLAFPVALEYIEVIPEKGNEYLKAVGVVGGNAQEQLDRPPIDYDNIPF